MHKKSLGRWRNNSEPESSRKEKQKDEKSKEPNATVIQNIFDK